MNPSTPDDDPRDAHLLAALRHAPDRDVAPPAPVSAAILDHARRAVRHPRPSPRAGWGPLWALIDRVLQPLPMAAFGTLALATLIGVMWGGRDVPDATPGWRPAPAAAPPASAAAGIPPPSAAPVAAVPADERAAAPPRSPPAPAATRPAGANRAADADARPVAAPERRVLREAAGAAAAEAALPPAAPAPAPAITAEAPPRPAASRKSLADAALAPLRARGEAPAPALGAVVEASPLSAIDAEIDAAASTDAARVRWRVAPQRLVTHADAQREVWSSLVRATRGHWQPAAPGPATAAEGPPFTLLIDGAARGDLSFEPRAVVWRDAQGRAWRAPMPAETLRGWPEAMARW